MGSVKDSGVGESVVLRELRFGPQLELELFVEEPWSGVSPRVLTRAHRALSSRRKPGKATEGAHDFDQLEIFPENKRAGRQRCPAPSAPGLGVRPRYRHR